MKFLVGNLHGPMFSFGADCMQVLVAQADWLASVLKPCERRSLLCCCSYCCRERKSDELFVYLAKKITENDGVIFSKRFSQFPRTI